ncbi:serine/threonine-protein kinase [Chromohalobacter moromii]|uniref:non-specific serine/threonine protein kinase n=1 Tax=Chromohalobacter moromii TaxID=2860329 RepID=A0A9X2X2M8_9GAMM|nr:serine/threonine-protein kinase [Chromohalobacter moromii]MCK2046011.1 serine/threonine protein kinase [Chromohalobacter moromii]MCT8505565.1 serine/threonine protein kinase [Chromohalobacter moromii]
MLNTTRTAELSFHIRQEIGLEGKNSTVFTATDVQLNADIVVKKMLKSGFSNVAEYFTEASLLHLSSHPNVVPIYYACQDDDHIFLAMPYFANGSLKKRIKESSVSVREIIIWSTQILSGLHNIHSKSLIHFDVKPDNVLFSNRGEALVSDFGLTKQTTYSGVAGQDRIYGNMVPPEAFSTQNFNNQFDIYQFGLTLHRMCVGDDVFYAEYATFIEGGTLNRPKFRHAVVNGQFPNKNGYPEHIPQALTNTIKKCLATSLDDRYISAIDVVNDLSNIDGELLDWRLSYDGAKRTWYKKATDGRELELTVDERGSSEARKTSVAGNTQRITEYCKSQLNRSDIKRFLRRY